MHEKKPTHTFVTSKNKNMKAHFLALRISVAIFVFFSSTLLAYSQSNTGIPIGLFKVYGNHHNKWEHKPRKSPSGSRFLPYVSYQAESETLIIEGSVSLGNTPYRIENEDGEEILSGILTIEKEQEHSISICMLPLGTYYIILRIGDDEYKGEFTKQ